MADTTGIEAVVDLVVAGVKIPAGDTAQIPTRYANHLLQAGLAKAVGSAPVKRKSKKTAAPDTGDLK